MNETKKVGFVNGQELKKGDKIQYQIKGLCGVDYDPPVVHEGVVVTPSITHASKFKDWVVQITPAKTNEKIPNYDFSGGVWAIYGSDIIKITNEMR